MWCQSNNTTPRIKHKLYDLFFLNKIASSACKTKKTISIFAVSKTEWSIRLTVRTSDSQSGNKSSILLSTTCS